MCFLLVFSDFSQNSFALHAGEAEWMAKQPRGRQAKQQARQTSFFELKEKTKDMPTADLKVDFASTGMARQGEW